MEEPGEVKLLSGGNPQIPKGDGYTNYVQLCFHNGPSLDPLPPKTSKHPNVRYLDIHEHDNVDGAQLSAWFEQGTHIPGERL